MYGILQEKKDLTEKKMSKHENKSPFIIDMNISMEGLQNIPADTSLNKEFKTKRIGELIKVEDEQGESEEVKAGQEDNQDVEEASK